MSHGAKQDGRAEQRRAQILDAAYRVFAEKGYRDTTIADIAKVLGMGHGTFYRYFRNKYDVFEQVIDHAMLRLANVIAGEDPHSTNTLEEYRAQVDRICSGMFALFEEDTAVQRILFYEAMGISPELDERIQQVWELSGEVTEAYLINGKQKGFLRADLDTRTTAFAINAMAFEGGRRIVRSTERAHARGRWVQGLVTLIFGGIAQSPPPAAKPASTA